MTKSNKIVTVTTKFIPISFTKLSIVLVKIKNKSYFDALSIIKSLPQKASNIIWKTLFSAASNATNNYKIDKNNLYIHSAFVNKGPILKRMQPRAKGKSYEIQKKMSHLTIKLIEIIN